jgi:hypothetical protein
MVVHRFTKSDARIFAKKYHIDLSVVPLDEWHAGLNIEREHSGIISKLTDIVGHNRDLVAKIAIAHLAEDCRYYYFLEKQEQRRERYWKSHKKPSIFL